MKLCVNCKSEYTPNDPAQKFCSKECKRHGYMARRYGLVEADWDYNQRLLKQEPWAVREEFGSKAVYRFGKYFMSIERAKELVEFMEGRSDEGV